jgi:hypothetical protein
LHQRPANFRNMTKRYTEIRTGNDVQDYIRTFINRENLADSGLILK